MQTQTSIEKPTPRRTRPVQMIVRMSQEEKDFIMKKVKQSGHDNFNLYALKMLIVGEIKNVDLTHYQELAKEVSRIGTNINQIAKSVNTHERIYEQQMTEIQNRMEDIWQLLKSNLSELR